MVRPSQPDRVTLDDLIRSNAGQTFAGILTALDEFWKYDRRESVVGSLPEPTEQ